MSVGRLKATTNFSSTHLGVGRVTALDDPSVSSGIDLSSHTVVKHVLSQVALDVARSRLVVLLGIELVELFGEIRGLLLRLLLLDRNIETIGGSGTFSSLDVSRFLERSENCDPLPHNGKTRPRTKSIGISFFFFFFFFRSANKSPSSSAGLSASTGVAVPEPPFVSST